MDYYPLTSIEISNKGKPICVQVIKEWKEKFIHYRPIKILMLADEQGNRIAATVNNYMLADFVHIEVGQWYNISNFLVQPNPGVRKWTEHELHIFFNKDTIASWCGPRREKQMTFFQKIKDIKDLTISSRMSIVDVIGGVVSVSKKVETQVRFDGSNSTVKYSELIFKVADNTGQNIKCYALGELAEDFEQMWIERDLGAVIFVALKSWDIRVNEVEGSTAVEACLYAENSYSEIKIADTDKSVKKYGQKHKNDQVFRITNIEDGYEDVIAEDMTAVAGDDESDGE